jgi:flagellar hook-associated protein 2
MANISGLSSLSNIDSFLNNYLTVERKPLDTLQEEKSTLQKKTTIFSDLKSQLVTLKERVNGFTVSDSDFLSGSKKAVSSNESIVTAEANSNAEIGVHTISISRIAQRDSVLSDRLMDSLTTNALKYYKKTQTFKVKVGESEKQIDIEFDDWKESNKDILDRVAKKLNDSGLDITASVISVDRYSSRLVVSSKETGSSNAVQFEDIGNDSFIKHIGLADSKGERKESTNFKGGYIIEDIDQLDAYFKVNGIEITQDSNTVSNVIKGVTLNLLKAQDEGDSSETITISSDDDFLKKEIQSFIDDYNETVNYISAKTSIDTSTNERGVLAGNYSVQQLKFRIREIVTGTIEGFEDREYNSLGAIGVEIQRDGTLKIADEDKFDAALSENSTEIQEIFSAEDGIAAKLKNDIDRYTKVGGVISDTQSSIRSKVSNIDLRVKRLNERIAKRETSLRRQFMGLQRVLSSLNTQQTFMQQFQNIYYGYSYGQQMGTYF